MAGKKASGHAHASKAAQRRPPGPPPRERSGGRRAGPKRQASEGTFRSIADYSPNMIFIWTAAHVVYANRMCAEVSGYSQAEQCAPEFDFRRLIAPASRPLVEENLRRHLRGEEVPPCEYQLVTRDGRILYGIHTTKLIEYEGERAILGIITDITERRRAELRLRESERRMRVLLDNVKLIAVGLDSEGRVAYANPYLLELTGYSAEEVLGTSWFERFVPAEAQARVHGVFRDTLLTGALPTQYENAILTRSGERRLVAWNNTVLFGETGELVGTMSIGEDITERRRAEEQVRKLHRAVEQSPVSVIVTDRDGVIEYVNTCFTEVTGYAKEEVLGRNPRLLKSGLQPRAFYGDLWRTIRSGREWSGQLQNRRKDGSLYWTRDVIAPVTDESGEITHFISLGQDVTEFRRQEEALEHSQAQLIQAQKSEAVGRLAGGIAHDFNNLMGVITGYSEILLRQLPASDPSRGKVEQIVQAADRAAGLTRQLLAYSRRQVLQPVVVDLNALLAGQSPMLEQLIGEDVELAVRGAPDLGHVLADPGQIEQVVMNLAVNARDAMPEGGRLSITTANEDFGTDDPRRPEGVPPGSYVRLTVTDTGAGMSEEARAHLFEPFFTTKEPGKGTGLGLSTVFGIVTQSGGHIRMASAPGGGTSAEVWLPRISSTPVAEHHAEGRASAPAHGSGRTVLVVEDNAPLRALTREVLETAGFRVLEAANGEKAGRLAGSAGRIDLLLTDVVLPKRGGPELAAEVKLLHPEAKVLFTSGYTADALGVHGVLQSGVAFLPKPASPNELLAKVAEVLGDESAE
jgi:PAS domain S-box-containing protein